MIETIKLLLLLFIVSVIVCIIANVELFISQHKASYSCPLVKDYKIITPKESGLTHPMYLFNTKYIKSKSIPFHKGFNKNNYQKVQLEKHLATRLNQPIIEFVSTLSKVPKSKMPLNTLFSAVSKGEEIANNADPSYNSKPTTYKLIYHKNNNVEAFITGDKFYLLN